MATVYLERGLRGVVVPFAHLRLVTLFARMGWLADAERHLAVVERCFTTPDPEVRRMLEEARSAVRSARGMARPEAGNEPALRALRAVGYDEALDVLAGRLTRAGAEQRTSLRTRQLAKRQRTWFRHQVKAVRLVPAEDGPAAWLPEILRRLR
jgi:tRNA A37 N6-isopentenylltransferase MiaA